MTDGRPRVVVTRVPPGSALERLADDHDLWVWEENVPIPREVLRERTARAQGLYCMLTDTIDAALLDGAPELRAISSMAVGVDNIDLDACTARGIPVGHTPDVLTETTADLAFALLLAAARRLVEGVDYVRAGRWGPWDPSLLLGHEVHGATIGVVGLGRIGRAVARRATGFGMHILYHARSRNPAAEEETGAEFASLEELLRRSDHVVILVPLTDETHHLIGAEELSAMKPTATLVNAARGPVVDPAALFAALRDGQIAAAALDVTDPEPIDPNDPLLSLPNCTIIPHLGSSSVATREAMADLAADNLAAALAGRPMVACANPEVVARR